MRFLKKLRARRGSTFAELLVAIAVLALLTGAVATGISGGMQVYRASTTLSQSQVLLSTLSRALADELRYAQDITAAPDGSFRYTSLSYGLEAAIESDMDGRLAVSVEGKDEPIPLIGSGAYGEYTADAQIAYLQADGCFSVSLHLLRGADEVQQLDYLVRALNPVP